MQCQNVLKKFVCDGVYVCFDWGFHLCVPPLVVGSATVPRLAGKNFLASTFKKKKKNSLLISCIC